MENRTEKEPRGEQDSRGEATERGKPLARGTLNQSFRQLKDIMARNCRDDEDHNHEKESNHMANIITLAGKEVGSPIVVFPDTIAGGSFVPGTLIRIVDNLLIQVSVGTVCIQDGPWKPVSPFVAGDQVFIPIRSIDAFV